MGFAIGLACIARAPGANVPTHSQEPSHCSVYKPDTFTPIGEGHVYEDDFGVHLRRTFRYTTAPLYGEEHSSGNVLEGMLANLKYWWLFNTEEGRECTADAVDLTPGYFNNSRFVHHQCIDDSGELAYLVEYTVDYIMEGLSCVDAE